MSFNAISHRTVIFCLTILALILYLHDSSILARRADSNRILRKEVAKTERESPVYVVSAYLIRDNFLRVILLQDCRKATNVTASFIDGENTIEVTTSNLTEINDGCPYKYDRNCVFDGIYAEFELPTKLIGDRVTLSAERDNQSSSTTVTVRRSTPSGRRRHHLAVCLPALFYYTDTIQLIEFIENWLLAGATKFFIYWQAISPQIEEILTLYKVSCP